MKKFLLTVLIALIGTMVFAQERIAVFPFEDLDNVLNQNEMTLFYRDFSNEFAKITAGKFTIVPRQDVEKLVSFEADFQLSNFSAREKTAEMRSVLNGSHILSGVIGRVNNNIRITVSLYTFPELQQLPGASLSVSNKNELFNKIPELVQGLQNEIGVVFIIPDGGVDIDGRPSWIRFPLTARNKYESSNTGISPWYYDRGVSNRTTTEQLAETRARQNVQQNIAENIGSEMKGRIDITSLSLFTGSDIEEAENRIEATLINSIRTRVPSYEILEWYIEKGNEDGRDWYRAYALVRFVRQDIIKEIEAISVQSIADTVIRNLNITTNAAGRAAFIRELESAKNYSLGQIRNAQGGR